MPFREHSDRRLFGIARLFGVLQTPTRLPASLSGGPIGSPIEALRKNFYPNFTELLELLSFLLELLLLLIELPLLLLNL